MTTAYSYIRFSSAEQKKGDSLRRQMQLSEEYAREHNLTLDDTLHLHDLGISAFKGSNITKGALGGFLQAVEKGRIAEGSFLLVESLDRLSRDQVLNALEVFTSILRRGITIVTLADKMVYNRESVANIGNLLISITVMARAHEESLTKSKRIKSAWDNKRANITDRKLTAQCPRWMRLSDDKTQFELIPERVLLVEEIIRSAQAGMGQAQIAKRLNERRIPHFSNHGKGWQSSYIQKILTSSALYGEFQPHIWVDGKNVAHGEPIPNYYPQLISKEDFQVLQTARLQRRMGGGKAKKGTGVANLLSGLLKCGYCGQSMILAGGSAGRVKSVENSKTVRPSIKVLMCDGGRRGLGCYAVQWSYKDFETSFLTFCSGLDLQRLLDDVEQKQITQSELKNLRDQLARTTAKAQEDKRRVEKLLAAIEIGDAPAVLLERIRHLESEIASGNELERSLISEISAIELSENSSSYEVEAMHDRLNRLNAIAGDDLFVLRVALAEQIRKLVKEIKVYPAGKLHSASEINELTQELLSAGYSQERVSAHIQTLQTEPKRQGRGTRGRYASRKDSGRHFVIKGKNGGVRAVYPRFDNPSEVVVELNTVGKRN